MTRAWTEKDLTFWRTEIQQARQKRQEIAETYGWDDNLKRYAPKPHKTALGAVNSDVNIGADFRDVERKKAALLFEFPEISLQVKQDREVVPASPQQPQALMLSTLVDWQGTILNTILGPEHANAEHAARKALFNCLCPAGVGPVTVGYQVTMRTETRTVPVLDPVTQQPMMQPVPALAQAGAMLGLTPPPLPEPLTQEITVEVPIHERWFVSDFSPKALLIPASFRDTNFARAPWLGKDWRKPTSQVRREHKLPADWTGHADDEAKPFFDDPRTSVIEEDAGDPYVSGVEIYVRAQVRSDAEEHPDALIKLVLVDGADTPLVYEDSPLQEFDETGALTPDSLKGFVDRPLVLRDLSDSAWIPSDCAVTAQLTRELEKFREQSITQRKNSRGVILFDASKLDPTTKDKIEAGTIGTFVPVMEGALAQGRDAIMQQVAQPTLGRETFLAQDYIEKDREQILGISANQTGVSATGRKTATEQTIVQRNSEARFEQERNRVTAWALDIAMAIDTLILRYMDARMASAILGETRGQLWAQHKTALAGCYGYDLRMDSGKYLDIEADRRQILNFYNIVRKDPLVNPRPLLRKIAEMFGYDAAEFVSEPPPPPKELKASFSFKGEDFNPLNPNFAIVVALARQAGWQIDEAAVTHAQQQAIAQGQGQVLASGVGPSPVAAAPVPGHPGAQPKMDTLNQHQLDETGARSGPPLAVN